ncbi:hypothetical protein WA158_005129 [Blastocystis sp. Blastoise]
MASRVQYEKKCCRYTTDYIELLDNNQIRESTFSYYKSKQGDTSNENETINDQHQLLTNSNNEVTVKSSQSNSQKKAYKELFERTNVDKENINNINDDYEEEVEEHDLAPEEIELINHIKESSKTKDTIDSSELDNLLIDIQNKNNNIREKENLLVSDISLYNEIYNDVDSLDEDVQTVQLVNAFVSNKRLAKTVELTEFQKLLTDSPNTHNVAFINTNNWLIFSDPMNGTFVLNYIKTHEEFKYLSITEAKKRIRERFPNIKYQCIYYAVNSFYTSNENSYSYIPAIIEAINKININNQAFFMLCEKRKINNQVDFNGIHYSVDNVNIPKNKCLLASNYCYSRNNM